MDKCHELQPPPLPSTALPVPGSITPTLGHRHPSCAASCEVKQLLIQLNASWLCNELREGMLAWRDKHLCPLSLARLPLPRIASAPIILSVHREGRYTIRENGEVKNIHSTVDNWEQKFSLAKPVINKIGLLQLHTHYWFPQPAPTQSTKCLGRSDPEPSLWIHSTGEIRGRH